MTPEQELRFWSGARPEGDCLVWQRSRRRNGYGQTDIGGKNRTAHRVAYELLLGPIPIGLEIDHVCRNRACIRPTHLRVVTRKQNNENRSAISVSRSGIRGVRWDKSRRKWSVALTHNYRTINIGRFDDLELAEQAAIEARRTYFTHST